MSGLWPLVFGCFFVKANDREAENMTKTQDQKPKTREVAAIILAAGQSSRMGAFKPLLPFGDKTVIEHTIDYLRRGGVARGFLAVVLGLDRILGLKSFFDAHRNEVKRLAVHSNYIARDMDTWDAYQSLHRQVFGFPPTKEHLPEQPAIKSRTRDETN